MPAWSNEAHIPELACWLQLRVRTLSVVILGRDAPTVEKLLGKATSRSFNTDKADQVFNLYPAPRKKKVKSAARISPAIRFISYKHMDSGLTWQRKTWRQAKLITIFTLALVPLL
jgi:hypothetical protein